jgi:hypothetical protein
MRENCDLEEEYSCYDFVRNERPKQMVCTLGEILDRFDTHETMKSQNLTAMIFDHTLRAKDSFLKAAYKDLVHNLDPDLHERLFNSKTADHNFLYFGNQYHAYIHAAAITDYFFQIANEKTWYFMHKRYFPYIGLRRDNKFGLHRTPIYKVHDYPEPGIPHTTLHLKPGDLFYFSSWHPHEVANEHNDRLGLALGIRPTLPSLKGEKFFPLFLHTLMTVGNSVYSRVHIEGECVSRMDEEGVTAAFNGSHVTRYDIQMVDGECKFAEREKGYQIRETTGEWNIGDWRPRF